MDDLPERFDDNERRAWKWLHDCQIREWTVDLWKKDVHAGTGHFSSLVEFAVSEGMPPR